MDTLRGGGGYLLLGDDIPIYPEAALYRLDVFYQVFLLVSDNTSSGIGFLHRVYRYRPDYAIIRKGSAPSPDR